MTFDMGGGTHDVAIIKIEKNRARLLAYKGHPFLGGQDVDNKVQEYFLNEFKT